MDKKGYQFNRKDCSFDVYKRGQIWSIEGDWSDKKDLEKGNHVENIKRPWLIVSVDVSNKNAPILNVVPITSASRPLPCHVPIITYKGKSFVMCEHVTTINKSDLDGFYYMGTLKENDMAKVDVALANQLGLKIKMPSMEVIENFINQLAKKKAEEMKLLRDSVSDTQVLDIAAKLEDIFDIGETPVVKKEEKPKKKVKEGPIKWTEEKGKEFLKDTEIMATEELCKKYSLTKGTIYSTKYRIKKKYDGEGKGKNRK